MIYIGIDPGLNGGIAFLDDETGIVAYKTPTIGGKEYDIQAMKIQLTCNRGESTIAFIENQISMPGQGLTSTLTTGKGFGIWLGLLAGLEIPYQVIGAQQWQKKLFTGVSNKLDTKAKSEVVAKRLFPYADFRKSERATKAHDGLTDAACIAEFGRRIHKERPEPITDVPHTPMPGNKDVCMACGAFLPASDPNDCKHPQLV